MAWYLCCIKILDQYSAETSVISWDKNSSSEIASATKDNRSQAARGSAAQRLRRISD